MTREEFKRFAAGQFVIGKPSVDVKELETYTNGAVFAYDELNKKLTTTKILQQGVSQDESARVQYPTN